MDDQISRQAAIDETWKEPSYTDPYNVLTEVRERIQYLPSAQPEQRWIPCSERLPKAGKEVFVYLFDDSPYIAWVDKNGVWNTEDFEVDNDNRPVAWMPLPKPYKGEEA